MWAVMLLWCGGSSGYTDLQLEAGPGLQLSLRPTAGIVSPGLSTANNHLSSHTIHHKHSIRPSSPPPSLPLIPQIHIYFYNPGAWGGNSRLVPPGDKFLEYFSQVMGQVSNILIYHFCIGGNNLLWLHWLRSGILNR